MRTYEILKGPIILRGISCLLAPGVHAVIVYRFGRALYSFPLLVRLPLDVIYYLLYTIIRIAWGIELPRGVKAGAGLYIGHFGGLIISSSVVIGKNCNISHGVTIGIAGSGERQGVPVIGDDVYIAPGAMIFGRICIGDNVKIGANSVIYKDIPNNAVVVLDPGYKIISLKGNRPID